MTTYDVAGRRATLLGTESSSGWVKDYWLDPDEAADSPNRTGTVLTVRPTMSSEGMEPFIGWGSIFAIAWKVAVPAEEPLARFTEALRQGSLRAQERMSGETGLAPMPRRYRTW